MPHLVLTLLMLAPQAESSGLEPGEGREVVWAVCTQCHTEEIILASHMSRETWDTTITWMQETQGMGDLEPDIRGLILDYLEETQGLEHEDGGGSSPWASPLYRPNPLW